MTSKKNEYTINLANAENDNIDLTGIKSVRLNAIARENIPLAPGFVISTNAFDEFIIQNSLSETIIGEIEKLDGNSEKSIKKASENILKLIDKNPIPEDIVKEIAQAYKNLSGFSKAYVSMSISPLNKEIDEMNYIVRPTILEDIHSEEDLVYSVKELWKELFRPEALKYREQNQYSGELSLAILAIKTIQSESSGRAMNFNPIDNSQNFIEINAMYGFENIGMDQKYDMYKVDKKNMEIEEKNIVTQEFMLVRNPGGKDEKRIKVPISKTWNQRQKLDDHTIVAIARVMKTIEGTLGEGEIEIKWSKEADRIFITDVEVVKRLEIHHKKTLDFTDEDSKLQNQLSQLAKDELKKIGESVEEERKIIPRFSQSHFDIKRSKPKPLDELKQIAGGKGNSKGIVWGHAVIVNDWDDLLYANHESILVISSKLPFDGIDLANVVYKGVIYDGNDFDIDSPAVFNVHRASELIGENEILTIDSYNGNIYYGKGIEQKRITFDDAASKEIVMDEAEKIMIDDFDSIKTSIETLVHSDKNTLLPKNQKNIDGIYVDTKEIAKAFAESIKPNPVILDLHFKGETEEIVSIIEAVRSIRNKDNIRNLWISISGVRREEDIDEVKKIMNAHKLLRTKTLKLFVRIDNTAAILGVKEVVDAEINGIIIDTHRIIEQMFGFYDKKFLSETAFETSIDSILKASKSHKKNVFILGDFSKKMIKDLIDKGVSGFIIAPNRLKYTRTIIAEHEIKGLKKQ